MTKALKFLAALLIALPVYAQAQRAYSQPELDQMLAPIALYPDPLLSQVLMAATYPADVIEAARWSRANPGLQGDDAVHAAQYEDWDPSVKSLLAFPQVLARMDENPDWTRGLGEAFLGQEPHVMDTVQQLRRRAQAAGNLQSSEQMYVRQQGQAILVQPASPQFVYVPNYDPYVVYGPWWWPAYRPVYWAPWPRPYLVRISLGFFFGNFDWHHRHVRVVHPTAYYYRTPVAVNRNVVVTPHRWQHEPQRRQPVGAPVASRAVVPATRENRLGPRIERAPAARIQAQPQVQAQPQAQQKIRMPAATAPQQPRAERREPLREHRGKPRNGHGHKDRERS